MGCLKCGRDVAPGQVFCQDCLTEMQKYPVDPATAIHLPLRKNPGPAKRAQRRRPLSPEEQVKRLRARLRGAILWAVLFTLLAVLLAYPAWRFLTHSEKPIGRNYSVVITEETVDVSRETSETAP